MFATAAVRFAFLLLFSARSYDAKCTIDLNTDLSVNRPLFLDMSSLEPIYPERNSAHFLNFNSGQKQLLYCPGGHITRKNHETNVNVEVSKCMNGEIFSSVPRRTEEYEFDEVTCSDNPDPVTQSDPKKRCMTDHSGLIVEIGYEIKEGGFRRTINLCHLEDLATTSWAHSKIHGAIGGIKPIKDAGTPAFSKGDFFKNVPMNKVYPQRNQVESFLKIFNGDQKLVDRYLPHENGHVKNYLVRGHLVARADQLYYAEQYSTYSYLNVLPMWQSINNGNWKSLETTVRRTSGAIGDLEVYTGGLGILRLSGKEIYLAHDKHDDKKLLIPVPRLLFKLVYSPTLNQALVFVTVNNPYLSDGEDPEDNLICRKKEYEPCRSAQFDEKYEGFTYCCLYRDFAAHKAVKALSLPLVLKDVKPLKLY